MSETNHPGETDSDNPFETNEAAIPADSSHPALPHQSEPAATAAATATEPSPEPAAAKTKPTATEAAAAWEEPQPAPITPPPQSNIATILVLCAIFAIVVFLGIQNYQLRTKLSQAQSQFQAMQSQVDALSKPAAGVSDKLKIISAVYGSGQKFSDVTDRVLDILSRPDYEFYAKPDWLKADPTPGWNKELIITFEYHGARHIFFTGEGGKVNEVLLLDATK